MKTKKDCGAPVPMVRGYIESMLWANTMVYVGDEMESLDARHVVLPFDIAALRRTMTLAEVEAEAERAKQPQIVAMAACNDFWQGIWADDVPLNVATERDDYLREHGAEQLGIDFSLSRNGHGAGFFDRGKGYRALQGFAKRWGGAMWLASSKQEDATVEVLE